MSNNIKYCIRVPETKIELDSYYRLRWEILRKPLGKSMDSTKDEFEKNSYHLIAITNKKIIIGVGRLHNINQKLAQIKYMAINKKFRGNGIGKKILLMLIRKASKDKITKIFLHSREEAISFYEKNNFKLIMKSHLLFNTIQHYYMEIIL